MAEKTTPRVGMKVQFPFQVAACCWVDLLGYGAAMKGARYNPLNPNAQESVRRIRSFHQIVADQSARMFPTLVMNDGAMSYRDLSYRTRWPTYDFLQRSFRLFDAIQKEEFHSNFPGARMVIAVGFRLRGRASQSNAERGDHAKRLMKQLEQGKISQKEAITKATQFRRSFDIIPQLQANFAFTKAYVAEQSGTKGGLPGPALYVDANFFELSELDRSAIQLGEKVPWKSDTYGMSSNFFRFEGIRVAKQTEFSDGNAKHHGPRGVRDALRVAELLAEDPNVLDALREARKSPRS